MAANIGETLSCVVLPLRNKDGILLPASALVEVVDSRKLNVVVDLQEGVIGKMQWKNTAIPFISYEAAAGLIQASFNSETKAVVIRVAVDHIDLKYMAVAASGAPKFIELTPRHIKDVPIGDDHIENSLAESRVQVDGQLLWVPDIQAVALHIESQVV